MRTTAKPKNQGKNTNKIGRGRRVQDGLPLWFDVGARADVVLGGEHELVVENPLGLVVQNCRGVELDNLVVLHRQVMPCTLQVGYLLVHKHIQGYLYSQAPPALGASPWVYHSCASHTPHANVRKQGLSW